MDQKAQPGAGGGVGTGIGTGIGAGAGVPNSLEALLLRTGQDAGPDNTNDNTTYQPIFTDGSLSMDEGDGQFAFAGGDGSSIATGATGVARFPTGSAEQADERAERLQVDRYHIYLSIYLFIYHSYWIPSVIILTLLNPLFTCMMSGGGDGLATRSYQPL
jgi:hypothetical protein